MVRVPRSGGLQLLPVSRGGYRRGGRSYRRDVSPRGSRDRSFRSQQGITQDLDPDGRAQCANGLEAKGPASPVCTDRHAARSGRRSAVARGTIASGRGSRSADERNCRTRTGRPGADRAALWQRAGHRRNGCGPGSTRRSRPKSALAGHEQTARGTYVVKRKPDIPEHLRELDAALSRIRFYPRASLGPEVIGRLRRGERLKGVGSPRNSRSTLWAIAAALVLIVAGGFWVDRSSREVTVDHCCFDFDGGGRADDGVLVVASHGEQVHRIAVYEDRDG